MKNRTAGILIIGIAVLIGFIIFSFNRALTNIVNTACSHGPDCPMWEAIDFQTNISTGIMTFVVVIGLYLIFSGNEKIKVETVTQHVEPKKITKKSYQKVMSMLSSDENIIFEKIIEAQGTIFQSDLVEKAGFTKVKVTRILDKLEGKNLIERRRRGMSNVVVLKH